MADITHIKDLKPDQMNPRRRTERNLQMIEASLNEVGAARSIVVDEDGNILAGNGTVEAAALAGIEKVQVVEADGNTIIAVRRSGLTEEQKRRLSIFDNRTAETAEWDAAVLACLESEAPGITKGLFTDDELVYLINGALDGDGDGVSMPDDAPPQIDKAEELRVKWGVELGQLWRLGEHRVICGDSTDAEVVARVMGGEKAELLHADPPYGMGKESEGIANDNLYREKLDAFQMSWWRACRPHITDNGSAYIWGNAEDLWRLWFCGGLRDSERLTLRNEIVWNKAHGQGMGSELHRMYPTVTERCLFFMIGEQGFSTNADNYWNGWEPIRAYLKGERDKMGWDSGKCKLLAGHSETSGCHWFDASQWSMPTRDTYNSWRSAAAGMAFKREYDDLRREYDDLRREYYATRAYFDNAHANMTDVWSFDRVTNSERWWHATPKPVEAMVRIVKTSSTDAAVILDPFIGSGTTLMACERLGRKCRGAEIDPRYVAVTLQRYQDATGDTPELIT